MLKITSIINNVPLGFGILVRCYYNIMSPKIIMIENVHRIQGLYESLVHIVWGEEYCT